MKTFTLLAIVTLLGGCGRSEPLIDYAMEPYASDRGAVRLPDGRLLNIVCMGQGSPTVILTAGLGDFTAWAWSSVQAGMAKSTRVCAWDRPGFGLSDGSPAPQTVATTVADLEAALAIGGIEGPYVMVGHSFGAYESLLFADRHRDEVVGMTLIDPTFPGQLSVKAAEAPGAGGSDAEADRTAYLRKCAASIRSGELDDDSSDPDNCLAFPLVIPPVLTDALRDKALGSPLQYETQASFNASGTKSSRLAINPDRDFEAMPLTVLSARWEPRIPRFILNVISPELAPDHERIDRGHQALAALSVNGVQQRVSDTSHYIQRDKPQVVIDAVEAVVREARAAAR